MTILIILIAPRAGALTDRVGSRWLVGVGMTLLAVMLFYYSHSARTRASGRSCRVFCRRHRHGHDDDAGDGGGDERGRVDKAGVGSAVLNSARQVGGSLGIAVMGAIVAPRLGLPHGLPRRVAGRRAPVPRRCCGRGARVRKVEHPRPAPAATEVAGDMTQTKQRLSAEARRQAVLDTACRVFSRSSYRGATTAEHRARGGHLRADPLPPLRLEARSLSRVPRRGVAAASARSCEKRSRRTRTAGWARSPTRTWRKARGSESSTSGSRR